MLHWLQGNNLDTPEVVNIFLQHRIILDNIKFLRDADLLNFGIKDWGTRISILEAVNKYFTFLPSLMDVQTTMTRQNVIENQFTPHTIQPLHTPIEQKRKFEPKPFIPNKRPKTPASKKRIRFKDLDVLVNDQLIPVDIGSIVSCTGSSARGYVVQNKQKKPVIEYTLRGKKQTGTVAQFYKGVTGDPLQAKGDSWTKIFFTEKNTNVTRSLEDIKYIIKGPKKAVSAFLYFSKEIRETLGKTADFAKKSGDLWKGLTEEQKGKYKSKELEDKERFNREKTLWNVLITQLQQQRGVTELGDMYGEGDSQDED